jgi:hypothetical protein
MRAVIGTALAVLAARGSGVGPLRRSTPLGASSALAVAGAHTDRGRQPPHR